MSPERAAGAACSNAGAARWPAGVALSPRVRALEKAVTGAQPGLCVERAELVTRYFRHADERRPAVVLAAEALAFVLANKSVRIHPNELLAGCASSHRVGGSLYPELHGLGMLEDLFRFERRSVNPLVMRPGDRLRLLRLVPFWLTRFLPARSRRCELPRS